LGRNPATTSRGATLDFNPFLTRHGAYGRPCACALESLAIARDRGAPPAGTAGVPYIGFA